ncbi:XkdX family protein [Bacillus subtilis]
MSNFWVIALNKNWATLDQVKEAYYYDDVTKEELKEGVDDNLITPEQYQEIVGEAYTSVTLSTE